MADVYSQNIANVGLLNMVVVVVVWQYLGEFQEGRNARACNKWHYEWECSSGADSRMSEICVLIFKIKKYKKMNQEDMQKFSVE